MTGVELSEIVRNWGLILAAAAGIAIALWRAIAANRQSNAQQEQVTQARREHVAALFGQAVQQLDDEKLHVRLGAIYMLREITTAFPDLSRPTVDLLAAYLRSAKYGDEEPPADIQAIIETLLPVQTTKEME